MWCGPSTFCIRWLGDRNRLRHLEQGLRVARTGPARGGRASPRRRLHVRTICVCVVSDSMRPLSSVTLVCQTMVRLPRWRGALGADEAGSTRREEVGLRLEGGRAGARGQVEDGGHGPDGVGEGHEGAAMERTPTVRSSSRMARRATTRSLLVSSNSIPRCSPSVPFHRSVMARGSIVSSLIGAASLPASLATVSSSVPGPTPRNYPRGNVSCPAEVVDSRHGAQGSRAKPEEAGVGQSGGRAHSPVARAPAAEPAHPRPRRGDLLPAPELSRDGPRQSEPRHDPPSRPGARGAPARPERAAPRRGVRACLPRARARRSGDGPGAARPRVHPAPAGALSRLGGRRALEHPHEQRGLGPPPRSLPRAGGDRPPSARPTPCGSSIIPGACGPSS